MQGQTTSFLRAETLGGRLARAGGSTSGFDYLRIGLAISVVLWHSLEASYSDGTSVRLWHHVRGLISLILPMFFSLSGFLVCGSLVRTRSTAIFISHRLLRLIPALLVEILLSALLLGPLMTTTPLHDYFASHDFASYFLNVFGSIHYHLPGVFETNPTPGIVNKSLWTIPYELECYLALIVISILGLTRRPRLFALLLGVGLLGLTAYVDLRHSAVLGGVGPPGRLLVLSFLSGVLLYVCKDVIPFNLPLFVVSTATAVVLLSFAQVMFLAALPVAYITVAIGLTTPKHIPVLMDGDYSYGLYLFAYPIQQTYSALFPMARHWWLNATFAIVFGLLYAFGSWNLVEKRVLSHRKWIGTRVDRLFGGKTAAALPRG